MAKRSVIAQVEEKQLRQASRYLKTRCPAETLKAALDFVAEKAAHEQEVRKSIGNDHHDEERFAHHEVIDLLLE
jgi:hypothetical protein